MKAPDVIRHVLSILEDDYCLQCFGADHCSVLFKDILCVRRYWQQLRKEHWQGKHDCYQSGFFVLLYH